jgi:uncharacterized Zn finger protein
MNYYGFRPYVPVAARRLQAARELEKLKKQGRVVMPVVIEGRTIARNFWGKAWCENLERYSDYANRLPRGRTYVRNGSVVDLQIARGEVRAMVSGSEIYSVKIEIDTASQARWKSICKDCVGSVGSLVELLQGKLSKHVMERVCREGDGLFPSPREIKMKCSCPDWADMCKHVAAVLYGAGARLDIAPDLLFSLRGVERSELIAGAGTDLPMTRAGVATERLIAEDDVAALFGIEMASGTSAFGAEATKRAPAAPDRLGASAAVQPTKEVSERKPQPEKKKQPEKKNKRPAQKRGTPASTAPAAIKTRQPRKAAAKNARDRTAKLKSPEIVGTHAKPTKSEPGSHRQNRTKSAPSVHSQSGKRR